jgi:quercetin dioxygenase-like cupin family protein
MRPIDAALTAFGADPRFAGLVSGLHIAPAEDPQLHAYVVHFEPCGRTAWHSHERGQLLICTAGHGYVGTRDGRVTELRPGVAAWTDPGEDHWHGAGPDSPLTHVAVQTEGPGTEAVCWQEQVEDAHWLAAIREIGVDGSPVNQYAPFYLWDDSAAAADFLWGGAGFGGIIGSFGRPVVHTWIPTAVTVGLVPGTEVTRAWLRTTRIMRGTDLDAAADQLGARIRRREADPCVHAAIAGINPTTWDAVEFITTGGSGSSPRPGGADTPTFSVLHISHPRPTETSVPVRWPSPGTT